MTEPFNSPLETGIRTLTVLVASYPRMHDLGRLVQYDYLVVHSADANGPPSLHPPLPMRSGELLVRRGLVERGLQLMMGRGLVERILDKRGVHYRAEEAAGAFLDDLREPYSLALQERADWLAATFDDLTDSDLEQLVNSLFSRWTTEFQQVEVPTIGDRL